MSGAPTPNFYGKILGPSRNGCLDACERLRIYSNEVDNPRMIYSYPRLRVTSCNAARNAIRLPLAGHPGAMTYPGQEGGLLLGVSAL